MTETVGARITITGDVRHVIDELAKLKNSLGGVQKQGKEAAAGLGKMEGPLRSFSQGNISGGIMGIANALGPVGIGAGIAATAIVGLVKAYDVQIERGRALINEVDTIADKFQLAAQEGNALSNFMRIMDVDASLLDMAFKTMAREGIEPSLAGLREVKERLDAIDDPAKRTAETVRLLGRTGLKLAETLGLSNKEFDHLISLAEKAALITDDTTDAQDAYNRELESYRVIQSNANVIATRSGLITKEAITLWYAESRALSTVRFAFGALGVEVDEGVTSMDTLLGTLHAVTEAKKAGMNIDFQRARGLAAETERWNAMAAAMSGNVVPSLFSTRTELTLVEQALLRIKSSVLGFTSRDWKIRIDLALTGGDPALLAWLMGGQQGSRTGVMGYGQGGGGTAGGGGKTLAPWATAADRAYAAAHPDQYNALGGNLTAGTHLVGEVGPELVINGRVIPAAETRRMLQAGLMPDSFHAIDPGTGGRQALDFGGGTVTAGTYPGRTGSGQGFATEGGTTTAAAAAIETLATALTEETAAIVAAMPSVQELSQAVMQPLRDQSLAIVNANAALGNKLDTLILLTQRQATNDGVGRAVRDYSAQKL